MALQKITGPDGTDASAFVVVDLDDAPRADGVARWAKKVLLDGARTMARSRTYAWALLGEQVSGASAGISAAPSERAEGIGAFVEAVLPRVRSGELSLDPGKGLSDDDLAPLTEADTRSALLRSERPAGTLADELLATSVATCASVALGGLDGRTIAVEGAATSLPALLEVLSGAGAKVVSIGTASGTVASAEGLDVATVGSAWAEHGEALPSALGSDLPAAAVLDQPADVLVCGSKLGLVDHEVAARLSHRLVVPCSAVPVTAKGLAVARRREIPVLADFLTTSGPLHAFRAPEGSSAQDCIDQARSHAATATSELMAEADGPLLAACRRAEDFLRSWRDELPFGRPLA